jgi:hypothetical protein
MSIALNHKENSSLLEIEARGKLTHDDYRDLMPKVERLIHQHGQIRMLFEMVDFHGWEASAMWDDTKFGVKHFADISRIAMVGDKAWEKAMSIICRPFTKAEVRYFDRSELGAAREWLDAPRKVHASDMAPGSGNDARGPHP